MDVSRNVSVVCPTYMSATFVLPTLRSVAEQSVLPLELIVVDDGSTDRTCELVESFLSTTSLQWRLLRGRHRGPGAARNAGIRAARGAWIAFIDSDDRWFCEKLARVAEAASKRPSCNFFCHNQEHVKGAGMRSLLDFAGAFDPERPVAASLMRRNIFTPSAVVCYRGLFDSFGFFDEDLDSAQDYEMWLRLSPDLRPHVIPAVLGCYIDRKNNITSKDPRIHLVNNCKLLFRHRHKVGLAVYCFAVVRTAIEFLRREWKLLRCGRAGLNRPNVRKSVVVASQPLSAFRRTFAVAARGLHFSSGVGNILAYHGGQRVRVLLFHNVAPSEMEMFAALLRWLARRWRFVTPKTFMAMAAGEERVAGDTLLLTFDDAFKSNLAVARDVLAPLGIKAIFFAPSDFVRLPDRQAERSFIANRIFDRGIAPEQVPDGLAPMSTADLANLITMGHVIGSHTRSHARLSMLTDAELDEELRGSAMALERELGVKIDNFAFPFGDVQSIGPRAVAICARHYRFVYSGMRGTNLSGASPHAIRRDAFQPTDSSGYVDAVLRGCFDRLYANQHKQLDRFAAIAGASV